EFIRVLFRSEMDLGEAQPGSVIADIELEGAYKPKNVSGAFYGLVSAREGLVQSHNVTTVKLYQEILDKNPAKDYLMKMGYSNLNAEDQERHSLAIDATDVSVEHNVNSFATIGNDGKYKEAYMIEK